MQATPQICGNVDCQPQGGTSAAGDRGVCLQPRTRAPHLVPGTPSARPLRAASLLPGSPSNRARGQGGKRTETWGQRQMPARPGEGMSYIQRPFGLAAPSRAPVGGRPPGRGTERGRRRAGATIGRGGQRSVGEPGPRGGKEVAATAAHQPRSAGGRMPLGAQSEVGGRGAGTRVPTPPRPARPRTPRGRPPPRLPAGRRSVPGGSLPPPRPLRSRGGSGPARQAGPGAPAGTRRRPALGRGRGG